MCTVSICALGFSQMTSKNGHTILPEAGDWSIQMNAQPLLDMAINAVNLMSDNGSNGEHPGYVKEFDQVIVGKYFNSDDFATRYKISLNSSSATVKTYAKDPTLDSDDAEDSEDVLYQKDKTSSWTLKLGYGHEYRRGHNRLQGFYGYEGMLTMGTGGENTSVKYEFSYEDMPGSSHAISDKNGMEIGISARAFTGVEYFFAPKMSIGAEFGWGLAFDMTGRSKTVTAEEEGDNWNENEYIGGESDSSFDFAVDNMDAALSISFHF